MDKQLAECGRDGYYYNLGITCEPECFTLLFKFRTGDLNMRAGWICCRNDMLADVGVLVAAGLVVALSSPWPDWIIAALIAGIVTHSTAKIIREARKSLSTGNSVSLGCCDND